MNPLSRLPASSVDRPPSRAASDADVVARILAGDHASFELIMRRYNQLLFRLARAIVGDDDEARDVVQAAYIRAYYHLYQFRGPYGVQSWLARIAINEAHARRRKRRAAGDDREIAALPAHEGSEPERMLIDNQTRWLVQQAIERLPEDFRVVFILRGVEQLSTAETAAALNIKEATVKTRFHRARLLLRTSLGRHADAEAVQQVFGFDGSRCDEIVAAVLARIRAR